MSSESNPGRIVIGASALALSMVLPATGAKAQQAADTTQVPEKQVSWAGEATADTNMFASTLLSRAEMVTGEASAVYGSDAASGVANPSFDERFQGLPANAQFGAAERWTLKDALDLVAAVEHAPDTGVKPCPDVKNPPPLHPPPPPPPGRG